jgi:hypothetical protein
MMKHIFLTVYILCIALFAIFKFKKQEYNWDMLPYMAIILSYDDSDINHVHTSVYNIIKEQTPPADYKLLVDGGVEMRKHSAEYADHFKQQLPYYTIKPLYTRLGYFFYKTGVPLTKATLMPSVVSYFFIGVFIFYWLKKYVHQLLLLPLSLLIMLCRPIFSAASVSTPDLLSGLILLLAFYFLIERKSMLFICIFLILSIFTRLDNIIPAVFIILLLTFTNQWKEKISLKKISLILLAVSASYFFVSYNATKYGWNIFYFPSFISHENLSYDDRLQFSFSNYFSIARAQIMNGSFFSDLILFLLLGLILFIERNSFQFKPQNFDQLLLIVIILAIICRFILQPIIADRFYIAYYITILILLIRKYSTMLSTKIIADE